MEGAGGPKGGETMATKVVCDICEQGIVEADTAPVEFHKARLTLYAKIFQKNDWPEADICAVCLHGAAKAHDRSPQPAERLYGPFRWIVMVKGVKTPGPHAGFLFEEDARRFVEAFPAGGAEARLA